CPFHSEKTPSFSVDRGRQAYYCFGCEKHGDAITFLREHNGLNFREALEELANRAGIQLPAFSGGGKSSDGQRAELLEWGKTAAAYYRDQLASPAKGAPAREYIKGRGLASETVKRFGLGFAPEGYGNLTGYARSKGVSKALLESSGLAKRGDRGLYDTFRNRVTFPIKDVTGNLVAFGGRDLGDSPAKYINSPESPVYKKSRVLYGLFEARDTLRKKNHAFLVEGYFDLLRCFDAGIENVVATCGTAVTPEQGKLIKRYVPECVVVFDGDAAGTKAALRAIGILTGVGLTVRALALPDGNDPDDYIKAHGAEAFLALADDAPDFITFYVRMSASRTGTIEGRTAVARELFEIVAEFEDGLRRDEYIKQLADGLGLETHSCLREFTRFLEERANRQEWQSDEPAYDGAPIEICREDRDFVAILMGDAALLDKAKEELSKLDLGEGALRDVLNALFSGGGISVIDTEEGKMLFASSANMELDVKHPDEIVKERIVSCKRETLRRQSNRLMEEIANAERSGDIDSVLKLVQEKHRLDQEIDRSRN
ncbi:MAG: DNA primase, partial [Candidatus Hydrogenedentes bacterium]|nr:DNA primase [Candidatus Hydrogenedentota bacterium]